MTQQRIAKYIAAHTEFSRRQAESLIFEGKVKVNKELLSTPAYFVDGSEEIEINGNKIVPVSTKTKLFLYYKPEGLVCSYSDEKGRRTIFDDIYENYTDLPRLVYIGRLDLNSEGLLLLTNNGHLSDFLSSPSINLVKKYKARVFGKVTQQQLDELVEGITINGFKYRPIIANIIRGLKTNMWIEFSITEGKNREIRNICEHLGLQVSKLIRTDFGPYNLDRSLQEGDLIEVSLDSCKKILTPEIKSKINF